MNAAKQPHKTKSRRSCVEIEIMVMRKKTFVCATRRQTKIKETRHSIRVSLFVCFIFRYIREVTFEYSAKLIEGVSVNIMVFSQSVKLPVAYSVFFYQFILRNSSTFHRFPKSVVHDHFLSLPHFFQYKILFVS